MTFRIARIDGDGIGPEVVQAAVCVLDAVSERFGCEFEYVPALAGGCAIDRCGVPLPDDTLKACRSADAVILGAVGGPEWEDMPPDKLPESALLKLRSELGLFANFRPAVLYPPLVSACPLRADIAGRGIDLVIVRELTGGLYFGRRGLTEHGAFDTMEYSELEIRRIGERALDYAMRRRRRLVSVDKANVLETSRLWRRVMRELSAEYPLVEYSEMYVDNAAMQLVTRPYDFDVIVTENMFGDILSDEAGAITGSIGLLPSASLGGMSATGCKVFGLYEPIHGSAPDIAGKNIANPIASILSAALMLELSLDLGGAGLAVRRAVESVLERGYRTADIAGPGCETVGTEELGRLIAQAVL